MTNALSGYIRGGSLFSCFSLVLRGEAVALNSAAEAKSMGSTFKTVCGRTGKQSMLEGYGEEKTGCWTHTGLPLHF